MSEHGQQGVGQTLEMQDPEECPRCHAVGRFRVIQSKRRRGYRRRVHRCRECGTRWPAFLTFINPRRAWDAMPELDRRPFARRDAST